MDRGDLSGAGEAKTAIDMGMDVNAIPAPVDDFGMSYIATKKENLKRKFKWVPLEPDGFGYYTNTATANCKDGT